MFSLNTHPMHSIATLPRTHHEKFDPSVIWRKELHKLVCQTLAPEVWQPWQEAQAFIGSVAIKGGQVEGNPLEPLAPMVTFPVGPTCSLHIADKSHCQRCEYSSASTGAWFSRIAFAIVALMMCASVF